MLKYPGFLTERLRGSRVNPLASRRSFLAAAGLLPASPLAANRRPPNFVIVLADDLGYGDVGVYGASGFRTPHLDRMAGEGVRFGSFYTAVRGPA